MCEFNFPFTAAPRFCAGVALCAFVALGAASAKDLDPDLRQQVIVSCTADAMRLCPQSLANESEAVSCMRKKRRELTDACRVAYDRVVRTLAQK